MSDYAQKAAELAGELSPHAIAASLAWLVYRVEAMHRRVARRLHRHHKRLLKLEHPRRLDTLSPGVVAP